jgi:hypothetical protein
LLVQIDLPDQAVAVALISGCTTFAVACVKAATQVAVAWIQRDQPPPPPPPREIDPPDP